MLPQASTPSPPVTTVATTGLLSETPTRPRVYAYDQYGLSEARTIVIEDLGSVPVVPVDFFLHSVLPPVNDDILLRIKKNLTRNKTIKNNKWSIFPKAPSLTRKNEFNAFRPLTTLFSRIVKANSPLVSSLDFVYKPNSAPISERNNASRPDAHLQLKQTRSLATGPTSAASQSHWEDIVVAIELKLHSKDWEDVRSFVFSFRVLP
jgi:hypothetical protein